MRASAASTAATGLSCLLWSWAHSSVRLSSIGASSEDAIAALKRRAVGETPTWERAALGGLTEAAAGPGTCLDHCS